MLSSNGINSRVHREATLEVKGLTIRLRERNTAGAFTATRVLTFRDQEEKMGFIADLLGSLPLLQMLENKRLAGLMRGAVAAESRADGETR